MACVIGMASTVSRVETMAGKYWVEDTANSGRLRLIFGTVLDAEGLSCFHWYLLVTGTISSFSV